jgi:hypothetical protein
MYWITRLDKFSLVLHVLAVASGVVGVVISIVAFASHSMAASDSNCVLVAKMSRMVLCIVAPMFFICLFGWAFTPTTKEYAAIKLIPAVMNNQEVRAETRDAYELMKAWLRNKAEEELPPERVEE